jgi:hypothetical protein
MRRAGPLIVGVRGRRAVRDRRGMKGPRGPDPSGPPGESGKWGRSSPDRLGAGFPVPSRTSIRPPPDADLLPAADVVLDLVDRHVPSALNHHVHATHPRALYQPRPCRARRTAPNRQLVLATDFDHLLERITERVLKRDHSARKQARAARDDPGDAVLESGRCSTARRRGSARSQRPGAPGPRSPPATALSPAGDSAASGANPAATPIEPLLKRDARHRSSRSRLASWVQKRPLARLSPLLRTTSDTAVGPQCCSARMRASVARSPPPLGTTALPRKGSSAHFTSGDRIRVRALVREGTPASGRSAWVT